MTAELSDADLSELGQTIAIRAGLSPEASELRAIVDQRMASQPRWTSVGQYHAHLRGQAGSAEWDALIERICVTESYFFRNAGHFRMLVDRVLPRVLADQAGGGPLRILSAGCATGQEPYSIAITLREHFPSLTRIIHGSLSGAAQTARFSYRDSFDDALHRLRCSALHLVQSVLPRGGVHK